MALLKDSETQTDANLTGLSLSVGNPVTLRDVFIEQQREIRNAEDRVMQLQCTYDEENLRRQRVKEEYNTLKSGWYPKTISDHETKCSSPRAELTELTPFDTCHFIHFHDHVRDRKEQHKLDQCYGRDSSASEAIPGIVL